LSSSAGSSLAVADQVGAADVDVDILRDVEAHELAAEMLRPEDVVGRDDAVPEDLLAVVDVVQEKIERGDALDQPPLDRPPLAVRDDARRQVEREDALRPPVVVVDREGDAPAHESQIDGGLLSPVLGLVEVPEVLGDARVVGANGSRFVEHLVAEVTAVVSFQEHGKGRGWGVKKVKKWEGWKKLKEEVRKLKGRRSDIGEVKGGKDSDGATF